MNLIKKVFSKPKEDALRREYDALCNKANEYERELFELIHQKVKLQLALSSIQKQKKKGELVTNCAKCHRMNKEIDEIIKDKENMLNEFKEIKKSIQSFMDDGIETIDSNAVIPQIELFFIMNDEYYLIDNNFNVYIITLCHKYKRYKEENEDDGHNNPLIDFINNAYVDKDQ